jgi:hypothetical protein
MHHKPNARDGGAVAHVYVHKYLRLEGRNYL